MYVSPKSLRKRMNPIHQKVHPLILPAGRHKVHIDSSIQ